MSAPHRSLLPLALLPLALAACSRTTVTAAPTFPSEQELAKIQAAPPPSPEAMFRQPPAAVDQWQLTTPLPDAIDPSPYAGADPFLRGLAERYAQGAHHHRVTEGMSCYAREKGRFWLTHQGWPAKDIDDFVAARCGTGAVQIETHFQYRERGPGTFSAAEVATQVDELVSSIPAGSLLGVWTGASERHEIIAVAAARPEVTLAPMPMTTTGTGFVDVRGSVRRRPGWMQGFVTHGERGHARCEPLPDQDEDTLALRCPVSSSDPYAMIEVYGAAPGEVLGHSMLSVMVMAPPVDPTASQVLVGEYQPPVLALPVDPHDHSTTSYLAGINHLRRQQSLAPLSLAHEQSELVEGLLPHYLGAHAQGDTPLAEQIALGMMAGWMVDGTIRDASMLSFEGNHAWSVERGLAAALLSPAYRATIFDPDDGVLALGVLGEQSRGARAFMMLSYELFEPRAYDRERTALLDALDRQRANLGIAPAVRIEGPKTQVVLEESIARIQSGKAEPDDELERVLQVFVESTGRGFRGQAFATLVIDGWEPEFPRDLLLADDALVAMMVTYRKAPGSAWGEHVVMFVYST